jgi:hypothetical protein
MSSNNVYDVEFFANINHSGLARVVNTGIPINSIILACTSNAVYIYIYLNSSLCLSAWRLKELGYTIGYFVPVFQPILTIKYCIPNGKWSEYQSNSSNSPTVAIHLKSIDNLYRHSALLKASNIMIMHVSRTGRIIRCMYSQEILILYYMRFARWEDVAQCQ